MSTNLPANENFSLISPIINKGFAYELYGKTSCIYINFTTNESKQKLFVEPRFLLEEKELISNYFHESNYWYNFKKQIIIKNFF